MTIHLHIERLVLDGVALEPGQRRAFESALRAQFEQGLAQGWSAAQLATLVVPSTAALAAPLKAGIDGGQLGGAIAAALKQGLGKP